ncbi:ceramide kinase [Athalia rosae]|uniref:ceramide kinase n=1 Tax=Athalia rosae TaxID=37344 RepID=UPI0020342206|nr:ceramide kinase [Athalia rosae]
MQDNDHTSDAVLLNTFVIRKKRCKVYFHRGTLIWETERAPYTRWTLPLTDVLAAHYGNGEDEEISMGNVDEKVFSPTSFTIHYAARGAKNKWSHHTVTMSHTDSRQVGSWVKTIRNYLTGLTNRPRKIMFFVNPFGGKKRGLKIWEKEVQPLLTLAGIETRSMVTERAGHIRDTLLACNLDDVQAVACVGGDGTFAEVFNGLVMRTVKDKDIDPNDPEIILPPPKLPVGVIPSGSTDTVAYSLHGTIDVQTAVLHIIFGDTIGLDLSSVHSEESLLRLYASMLSYGYLGDVIKDSEKFRWMGPQRYDYSGFKKIIANKGYEGEIKLLSDPCHPASSTKCTENCTRCIEHTRNNDCDKEIARWLTVRGKFFMVNGANVSCACDRSPMGFSPHCHVGDGCVDLILIRHTSFFNNIRVLLRLSSKNKNLYDLPFVEVYRAREFTFQPLPSVINIPSDTADQINRSNGSARSSLPRGNSVWNCDGEVIGDSRVKIRVHCQLLKVYTRRSQDMIEDTSCFC